MGGLALCLYRKFSLSVGFFVYLPFAAALLAIIFIDLRHQIIPDVISLPGIVLGFLCSFINPVVHWQEAGIGILCGGGAFYAVAFGYYLFTRRDGMGGGDIKLLAMIGAYLGWVALPFVVFSSALLGAVVGIAAMIKQGKGGQSVIPYGPFLAIGSYLFLFFREDILWAMQLYLGQ